MGLMSAFARVRRGYRRFVVKAPGLKPAKAYVNWIRANLEMLSRRTNIRARPLKLTFDPTNVCQLRCPLCPTGLQLGSREKQHAELDTFRRLMDEVGDYVFFMDFFNWGEPLLNKHLEDFLHIASQKAISTTVSSNLSLEMSDERVRRLVESGLNELIVSLDGCSPETYGTYRRQGDFELVVRNMRRIIEMKKQLGSRTPTVIWRMLVFRFNQHELPKAELMAKEIGVDRLVFAPPYLDEGRFPIPEKDRIAAASWAPTIPGFDRYEPQTGPTAPRRLRARPRNRCDWHYISTAINADGTVAPCCTTYDQQDDFGTLEGPNARSYMEIVNNDVFTQSRARVAGRRAEPVKSICEHCPTPDIMDYANLVNKDIVLTTAVQILDLPRRAVRRLTRRKPVEAL